MFKERCFRAVNMGTTNRAVALGLALVLGAVVYTLGKYNVVAVLAYLVGGYVYRASTNFCPRHLRLDGKTAIVTGASAGLGRATALELARRGARVVLACRNLAKAKPVAEQITTETGNTDVVLRRLDLSDLDSVREFAAQINSEEEAVHVLINNAGIVGPPTRQLTPEGHELTFTTNHYGPFLLTLLLLEKMRASAPSRVVNVSSIYYIVNQVDLSDLTFERRRYFPVRAYAQSKLANVLFTRELARRLATTGIVTNTLHPGAVNTEILKRPGMNLLTYTTYFSRHISRNADQGAQTQLYLALSEEGGRVSGEYYENCQKTTTYGDANNAQLARQLWDVSCEAVGLAPHQIPAFVR